MVDTIKFKTTLYKVYISKPSIANHKVYTHSQVKVGRGSVAAMSVTKRIVSALDNLEPNYLSQ